MSFKEIKNQANINGCETARVKEEEWKLVWSDEFEGLEINMSNWSFDRPDNGRYNGEIQSYTNKNAYIKDGKLIIEARKEDFTEPDGKTYHYTSSKLITQGKKKWTYGKFEIRAKMPEGKGIWPAIWMMPEDEFYYGRWPVCGEIDIMELLGDTPNKVYGTMHFGLPHKQSQGIYTLPEGESFAEDFHVYSIEWEPGEIRWYIDGNLYHKESEWYSKAADKTNAYHYPAPFNQDFFLILNISVGGGWPGNPDETTVFPQQMVVDYVRVYQKEKYATKKE
ncbi:MAG: glycoside hydrolase family 16 protein [Epulopiscium sp.]|nr:glycoside hydrolase family 16 protein [Candidatus Epulonipiscium sp.]